MRFLPETARLDVRNALLLIVVSLVAAVSLAELYSRVPLTGPAWLRAAVVNSVLAAIVLVTLARAGRWRAEFALDSWKPYLPAAVIGLGSVAIALTSRLFIPTSEGVEASVDPAWIFWIPVVEELVFRVGILGALRRLGGPVWSIWFGAVIFAMAHGGPTLARLQAGTVGVPIGPLLLGVLAGALYVKTNRVLPVMALHAVCNATPLIFATFDGRWIEWLGFLYQ